LPRGCGHTQCTGIRASGREPQPAEASAAAPLSLANDPNASGADPNGSSTVFHARRLTPGGAARAARSSLLCRSNAARLRRSLFEGRSTGIEGLGRSPANTAVDEHAVRRARGPRGGSVALVDLPSDRDLLADRCPDHLPVELQDGLRDLDPVRG